MALSGAGRHAEAIAQHERALEAAPSSSPRCTGWPWRWWVLTGRPFNTDPRARTGARQRRERAANGVCAGDGPSPPRGGAALSPRAGAAPGLSGWPRFAWRGRCASSATAEIRPLLHSALEAAPDLFEAHIEVGWVLSEDGDIERPAVPSKRRSRSIRAHPPAISWPHSGAQVADSPHLAACRGLRARPRS